jgi:hypothetical protein
MVNKKFTQVIEPFPAERNRYDFGHWLAGFTDGEGCFRLRGELRKSGYKQYQLLAQFCISLRTDDSPVLKLIQSYFGCGVLYVDPRSYHKHEAHPKSTFRITTTKDLVEKVIPHFKKFTLNAKKSRDFVIWEQGVLLLYEVMKRPNRSYHGRLQKWTKEELATFQSLIQALRQQREYDAKVVDISGIPNKTKLPTLFDECDNA